MEALEDRTVPAGTISVAAVGTAAEGGSGSPLFRFTRTGDLSAGAFGGVTIGGTATTFTDYSLMSMLWFSPDQATFDLTLSVTDDSTYEGDETVTVSGIWLTGGDGYTVDGSGTAEIVIADNEPPPVNHPPTLGTIADQYLNAGLPFQLQLSASDPDGDPLQYTASGLPPGLSFDAMTHSISGIPSAPPNGDTTTYAVTFTVTDGRGGVDQKAANFVVRISWLVNTPMDTNDSNLADGVPLDLNGKVSLRAAMQQAASYPQGTTIGFDTVVFPGVGNIALGSALIAENVPITINGVGRGLTISGGAAGDGILLVRPASILSISNLSLQNGVNNGNGGGISNQGTLTLTNVGITNCVATNGGAVYSPAGSITLTDCDIVDNRARAGGFGAGIDISGGTASITNTGFQNNVALGRGGAVAIRTAGAQVSISGGSIAGNQAQEGAGIYNSGGTVSVQSTTIQGNSAAISGGGIQSGGTTTFVDVTMTANTAGVKGGGWYIGSGSVTINGGVIEESSAPSGAGIQIDGGSVAVVLTSIRNNTASERGGGVYIFNGSLSLSAAAFQGNDAPFGTKIGRKVAQNGVAPNVDVQENCTGVTANDIENEA